MGIFSSKKDNKTQRHEGVKLNRCPCGAKGVDWIPNGMTEEGTRLYSPMCPGCGDIVNVATPDRWVNKIAKQWNAHMKIRQDQEGGQIDEPTRDEEA